jgi:hypothetical protein
MQVAYDYLEYEQHVSAEIPETPVGAGERAAAQFLRAISDDGKRLTPSIVDFSADPLGGRAIAFRRLLKRLALGLRSQNARRLLL